MGMVIFWLPNKERPDAAGSLHSMAQQHRLNLAASERTLLAGSPEEEALVSVGNYDAFYAVHRALLLSFQLLGFGGGFYLANVVGSALLGMLVRFRYKPPLLLIFLQIRPGLEESVRRTLFREKIDNE